LRNPSVLIVAYNFPPHGAVGTLRTLRLVQELARRRWRVAVVAGAPSTCLAGESMDPGLLAEVPAATNVHFQWAVRPVDGAQRMVRRAMPQVAPRPRPATDVTAPGGAATSRGPGYLRRGIDILDQVTSIPDQEAGWILPATARALAVARRLRPDVIYSTAPPWSAQIVAYLAARATGTPWVADFRDPWARAPWREDRTRWQARVIASLERRVIRRANAVVFNTRTARADFEHAYGATVTSKLHVVPNGCNLADFVGLPVNREERFVLLHAGTLYGGRDPSPLLEALALAARERALPSKGFVLRFVGVTEGIAAGLTERAVRLGIGANLECSGRISRRESLLAMSSAGALLLLQPGHALSVPAKTYEYMAARRPILALADEGETARVIRESGAGTVVTSTDPRVLAAALLDVVRLGESSEPWDGANPALYDGAERARELADILESAALGTRVQALGHVSRHHAGAHGA
jgi:glycosyltransferase involved in cell wall biosynthesis